MLKKIIGLIIIFSSLAFAQVDPAVTDIVFIPYSASDTYRAEIARNTINENLLVVYNNYTINNNLYARMVAPNGTLGPQKIIATNLASFGYMALTWHPVAKRYMVIFKDGTDIKVRVIRANGNFAGGVKKVTTYSNGPIKVCPANKRRFIVFYQRGEKLAAMSLRKNGNKFKSEKIVYEHPQGQIPFTKGKLLLGNAHMDNSNESALFYLYRFDLIKTGTIKMIKLDHKLNEIKTLSVGSVTTPPSHPVFLTEYDPVHNAFAVIFDQDHLIFKEFSRGLGGGWNALPTNEVPLQLKFDPVSEQFGLLTVYTWEVAGNDQGAKFYISFFDSTGTFLVTEMLLQSLYNDTVNGGSLKLGFNPGGLYLITWGWDYPSHGGFFGKYFN